MTSRSSMNWSILPSESQVRSAITARRVGRSFSRCSGMDREELLHRPVVGHRLEHGEVAVVGVGQALLQAFEVVRHVLQLADDLEDGLAAAPEQLLDAGAAAQVQQADVEEVGAPPP